MEGGEDWFHSKGIHALATFNKCTVSNFLFFSSGHSGMRKQKYGWVWVESHFCYFMDNVCCPGPEGLERLLNIVNIFIAFCSKDIGILISCIGGTKKGS